MTHDPAHRQPRPPRDPRLATLTEQWRQLTPDERQLLILAVDALHDGHLSDLGTWRDYTHAVLELLPAIETITLTTVEVHRRALDATR